MVDVLLQFLADCVGLSLREKLDHDIPLRFKNKRSYVLYYAITFGAAVAFIAGLMFLAWLVWH